jgi:hypothetical protein
MSISSTTRKAGPFTGNDVTTVFPFTFKVFAATDVVVVLTSLVAVETTLALTTDYTVSLNADQNASPGGSITLTAALTNGYLLTITSAVPSLQPVALTNNGGFYPVVINDELDRLTIIIQQALEQIGRSVRVPISSSTNPDALISQLTADAASAAASAAAAANSAYAAAHTVPVGTYPYTPANQAGDTFTGNIAVPGINVGGSGVVTSLGSASAMTASIDGTMSSNSDLKAVSEKAIRTYVASAVSKQIQPVAASIDAIAQTLTLTLNPTTLAFRSTTPTNGASNVRSVGGAISLVVSSGSTLGTISTKSARLVILAIDNAGTVELAVVNIAGGKNLDETTLISTTAEGGAGLADSSSTIYSNVARTNVPFRVVGFIDITEATAGTWTTAPTNVQGAGGQALAAMSSLGYGQTWATRSGAALGTTYYNTSGKPIIFKVAVYGSTTATLQLTVNGTTLGNLDGSVGGGTFIISDAAVVPPGGSYSANQTSGGTLSSWLELS